MRKNEKEMKKSEDPTLWDRSFSFSLTKSLIQTQPKGRNKKNKMANIPRSTPPAKRILPTSYNYKSFKVNQIAHPRAVVEHFTTNRPRKKRNPVTNPLTVKDPSQQHLSLKLTNKLLDSIVPISTKDKTNNFLS